MSQPVPDTSTPGLAQPGSQQTQAPDWFIRYLRAALADPLFSIPKTFETWMADRVAVAGFDVPIGQIVGFSRYTAQAADLIVAEESTTSTTFGDLTTPGPELTGLPDGNYLFLYGAAASGSVGGGAAAMSIQVNADAVALNDAAASQAPEFVSTAIAVVKPLTENNNTVTAKYLSSNGDSVSFLRRWLIALRYSNL